MAPTHLGVLRAAGTSPVPIVGGADGMAMGESLHLGEKCVRGHQGR